MEGYDNIQYGRNARKDSDVSLYRNCVPYELSGLKVLCESIATHLVTLRELDLSMNALGPHGGA